MSTLTLPTKIHFMSREECRLSLIQHVSGHSTVLFLNEKDATELALLPLIETMNIQGKLVWVKTIPSYPSHKDIAAITKALIGSDPDLIVAIGSSETLNYAKVCGHFKGKPTRIAVPSTGDTISILLPRVAHQDKNGNLSFTQTESLAFDHATIVADFALTSSNTVTLSSAYKALALAGDAYWAKTSTTTIRLWALQAIRLIIRNLPKVLKNPDVANERQQLLYGSLLAAMAASNTEASAVSALSTSLAYHCHIDEGLAAAMVLPDLLRINLTVLSNPEALYDAFNINNPEALRAWLESQSEGIISLKLSDYGVSESELKALAQVPFTLGFMVNNPIELDSELIETILKLHL